MSKAFAAMLRGDSTEFDRLVSLLPPDEPEPDHKNPLMDPQFHKRGKFFGFPEWYYDAPKPQGDKWWAGYMKALPIIESGGIVAFYGTRGTGKTRMAYELGQRATLKDKRNCIECVSAMRIFLMIRDSYRKDAKTSELEIIDSLTECALLVIDEFQERGETDFENKKITHIIDERYKQQRPTILIANLSRDDFAKQISDSVKDRIAENGGGVLFDWGSYRRTKKDQ